MINGHLTAPLGTGWRSAIVVIGGAISIALLTRVFHPTPVYVLHNYVGLSEGHRTMPLETPTNLNRRMTSSEACRGRFQEVDLRNLGA